MVSKSWNNGLLRNFIYFLLFSMQSVKASHYPLDFKRIPPMLVSECLECDWGHSDTFLFVPTIVLFCFPFFRYFVWVDFLKSVLSLKGVFPSEIFSSCFWKGETGYLGIVFFVAEFVTKPDDIFLTVDWVYFMCFFVCQRNFEFSLMFSLFFVWLWFAVSTSFNLIYLFVSLKKLLFWSLMFGVFMLFYLKVWETRSLTELLLSAFALLLFSIYFLYFCKLSCRIKALIFWLHIIIFSAPFSVLCIPKFWTISARDFLSKHSKLSFIFDTLCSSKFSKPFFVSFRVSV